MEVNDNGIITGILDDDTDMDDLLQTDHTIMNDDLLQISDDFSLQLLPSSDTASHESTSSTTSSQLPPSRTTSSQLPPSGTNISFIKIILFY